jgi:hypothetical protein
VHLPQPLDRGGEPSEAVRLMLRVVESCSAVFTAVDIVILLGIA